MGWPPPVACVVPRWSAHGANQNRDFVPLESLKREAKHHARADKSTILCSVAALSVGCGAASGLKADDTVVCWSTWNGDTRWSPPGPLRTSPSAPTTTVLDEPTGLPFVGARRASADVYPNPHRGLSQSSQSPLRHAATHYCRTQHESQLGSGVDTGVPGRVSGCDHCKL
jgi:hypothetical protein